MKKFLIILLLLLVAAAGATYYFYKYRYLPQFRQVASTVSAEIEHILMDEILVDPFLLVEKRGANRLKCTARMPYRYSPEDIEAIFRKYALSKNGLEASFKRINLQKLKGLIVEMRYKKEIISKIRLIKNSRPKVAIILDDWGYNNKAHEYVERIKQPFTMAVLPNLPYSKKAAELGHKYKKSIILHLPLEPGRRLPLEKNTIKTHMADSEIRYILDKQVMAVPYAVGVNNHQGSLATKDERVMSVIMQALKSRNMFFIDSYTSAETKGYETAKKMGVKTNTRDIFVDNEKFIDYNEMQLRKLVNQAKKRGYAIGIGHDDPVTMQALEKNMPMLEEQGVEFVFASELIM